MFLFEDPADVKLLKFWKMDDIHPPPGVSVSDIQAFEDSNRVQLPLDFRNYFLKANGLGNGADPEGFAFWMLSKVTRVEDSDLFAFADYDCESWSYGIELHAELMPEQPVFMLYYQPAPIRIARTFLDFIDLYIARSLTLIAAIRSDDGGVKAF